MTKVTVLGAAGGIGQPLSLLLKMSPYVSRLALYDLRLAPGVARDLSHINTNSKCTGYDKDELREALDGAHIVVIPAGVPRKPGMTRDDLFKINAGIVANLVSATAKYAPSARILVISNPVNSTVPVACETLKKMGVFQPGKVMGVTTLDVVRAQTFLSDSLGADHYSRESMKRHVTVVGGHSGTTIVPIVTDPKLRSKLVSRRLYDSYIHRVQFGGDEVVEAKQGAGSATLSMALAGFQFVDQILRSIHLEKPDVAPLPAFVYLPGIEGGKELQSKLNTRAEYFAAPVELLRGDVVKIDSQWLEKLGDLEKKSLAVCLGELDTNIQKGRRFVQSKL
ncbi:LANO_0H03026g1_1 [Lachancea nothofagi CBS 11611]|uniref:Malate dehydrogenase n=1 Tax=Lachancea nothofagi CBS 11611 TaxID=1266666 RepID=A0A1G4KL68_9SACH|nr:LANO_0H03026g1_1 [Lachancea nothofagi CBS 11611]